MRTYNQCVEKARTALRYIKMAQYEIAQLALEACEIRHGGISDGYYTITNFADSIDMNNKTLQRWICVYRDVLLKADITKPTEKEWSSACKVESILKNDRMVENKKNGQSGTLSAYKKDIPKETINQIFNDIHEGNTDIVELNKLYKSAKHIYYIARKVDMKAADYDKLLQTMENLDRASEEINYFLTKQKEMKKAQ